MKLLPLCILCLVLHPSHANAQKSNSIDTAWPWPKTMRQTTQKFTGKPGKVILMGDSLTYANQAGRWARYGKKRTPAEIKICRWMKSHLNNPSNGWWLAANDQPRGRSWTAASGCTSAQYLKGGKGGLPSLDKILKQHNPQIASILLGANDLSQKVPTKNYLKNMQAIYLKCLANGTIPIVQTVPPTTWDRANRIKEYNKGLIALAKKHNLPLIDVHREFLTRRPGDTWKGTLVSKDGAHFTHALSAGPANTQNLRNDGYLLRCWLQVHKIIQIKSKVLDD